MSQKEPCEKPSSSNQPASNVVSRWRHEDSAAGDSRRAILAFTSCLLAVLAGTLFAIASLPAPRPHTVLVALYLPPPDRMALGIDAPHPPDADRLFGLMPTNLKRVQAPVSETHSAETVTPDPGQTTSDETAEPAVEWTDWRDAIVNCRPKDQLVLHVASLVQVEHEQLFLVGRPGEGINWEKTEFEIKTSLATVLTELQRCPARRKLLVLDVHWPLPEDAGDSSERLKQINQTIDAQLVRFPDPARSVLLASDGQGPARGMTGAGRSLHAEFLSLALATPEADLDRDGRTTLTEAIHWAQPRIEAASRRLGPVQSILLAESNTDLVLPPLERDENSKGLQYPEWLGKHWETRQRYLDDLEIPWIPDLAAEWGLRLAQLESRWRRGEEITGLIRIGKQLEADATGRVDQALGIRCQRRRDSLLLAATRFSPIQQAKAKLAQEVLWESYLTITDRIPDEQKEAVIDQAIAKYVAAFEPGDAALAVAKLVEPLGKTSEIDRQRLQLIDKVRAAWNTTIEFPLTETIRRVAADPLHGGIVGDDQRRAQLVQLLMIQDRLAAERSATAWIRPLTEQATKKLATAQRLAFNPGMASEAVIDRSLRDAMATATAALDAEQAIGLALRRLGMVATTLETDRALGVTSSSPEHIQELDELSSKVVDSLNILAKHIRSESPMLSQQLLLLQQASESLHREWQSLLEQQGEQRPVDDLQVHAGLSIALSAVVRAKLFNAAWHAADLDRNRSLRTPVSADHLISADALSGFHPTMKLCEVSPLSSSDSLASVSPDVEAEYRQWWTTFVTATRTIDAIPIYRRIAERQSISGLEKAIPIEITGNLESLSWDNPCTELSLRYLVDLPETPAVDYEFLQPVTKNLHIHPNRGRLGADETQAVTFTFIATDAETPSTIHGVWLQATLESRTELIPVKLSHQPTLPEVEVDFGTDARSRGRQVELMLWPDTKPRSLEWTLTVHTPSVSNVIASLQFDSGATLTSPPLAVSPRQPSPIRFLPPTNPKDPAAVPGESMIGPIKLTIREATKGRPLGSWVVNTRLRDPRQAIRLGEASYQVQRDGRNRLEVRVGFQDAFSSNDAARRYRPLLRLGLEPQRINPLIDFGQSRLSAYLSQKMADTTLYAENLRVTEGAAATVTIPLSIDGDEGIYEIDARLPRGQGSLQLPWNRTPSLSLEARPSTVPGEPLATLIRARNLDDEMPLIVEYLDCDVGSSQSLWRTELPTSRQTEVRFDAGGKNSTLAVTALRRDWEIAIPTDFGTGRHRLRVATAGLVGDEFISAERGLLIDDGVPDGVHAHATSDGKQTTILISMRPGASGVSNVSMHGDSTGDKSKPVMVVAKSIDEHGSRWRADWPAEQVLPPRLDVIVTTGAGKQLETACELAVQRILPVSRIIGQVREGAIPQPSISVRLLRPDGSPVTSVKTDSNGRYQIDAAPGQYLIRTDKLATGRSANATVEIKFDQTRTIDLSLLIP